MLASMVLPSRSCKAPCSRGTGILISGRPCPAGLFRGSCSSGPAIGWSSPRQMADLHSARRVAASHWRLTGVRPRRLDLVQDGGGRLDVRWRRFGPRHARCPPHLALARRRDRSRRFPRCAGLLPRPPRRGRLLPRHACLPPPCSSGRHRPARRRRCNRSPSPPSAGAASRTDRRADRPPRPCP